MAFTTVVLEELEGKPTAVFMTRKKVCCRFLVFDVGHSELVKRPSMRRRAMLAFMSLSEADCSLNCET